ncbi:hypothetical protein LguiA_017155 [Lonicera macranthoides]
MPWSCPPLGCVKCNVNASIDSRNNCTGFGFIIRDHEGNFLVGGAEASIWETHTLLSCEQMLLGHLSGRHTLCVSCGQMLLGHLSTRQMFLARDNVLAQRNIGLI